MRLLALIAVVSLVACDTGMAEQDAFVEIKTDRPVYTVSADLRIEVVAANVSERPLYYACNGMQHKLERLVGRQWVEVGPWYGRYFFYCDPSRLEPGEASSDIPPITRPEDNGITLSPGTYRIQSVFFKDVGLTDAVAADAVTSVPFEIR